MSQGAFVAHAQSHAAGAGQGPAAPDAQCGVRHELQGHERPQLEAHNTLQLLQQVGRGPGVRGSSIRTGPATSTFSTSVVPTYTDTTAKPSQQPRGS
jgi:hypothetical protein